MQMIYLFIYISVNSHIAFPPSFLLQICNKLNCCINDLISLVLSLLIFLPLLNFLYLFLFLPDCFDTIFFAQSLAALIVEKKII